MAGRLHKDTAYGIVDGEKVVSRKPLLALKNNDIALTKRGANIRDADLKRLLERVTRGP